MRRVVTMMTTGATMIQPNCQSAPSTRRKVPVRLTGTVFRVGASVSAMLLAWGAGGGSGLLRELVVGVQHLGLGPRLSLLDRHLVVDDLLDHVRERVLRVRDVSQPCLRGGRPFTDTPNFGDLPHLGELARLPEVALGVVAIDRNEAALHGLRDLQDVFRLNEVLER